MEIRDESDHLPISSKIVLGKKKIIRANCGNQHYFNNGSEHLPKIEKYKWKDAHKQNFIRIFENSLNPGRIESNKIVKYHKIYPSKVY